MINEEVLDMSVAPLKWRILMFAVILSFIIIFIPQNASMEEQENGALEAVIIGTSEFSAGAAHTLYLSIQNNTMVESIDPALGQFDLSKYIGAAVGVSAELKSDDRLLTIETGKLLLGTIPSGAVISQLPFSIRVSDQARRGPASLFLDLTYMVLEEVSFGQNLELAWSEKTQTIELPLEILEKPLKFTVTDVKPVLKPGMDDQLYLTVVNEGSESAKNATAKISVSSPFTATDDIAFLGTLEPNDSATGIFGIKIAGDAIAKDYIIDAQIKYFDEVNDEILSDKFQVSLKLEPPGSFLNEKLKTQLAGGLLGAVITAIIFMVWMNPFTKNKQKTDR
jgi:hypothetical protein